MDLSNTKADDVITTPKGDQIKLTAPMRAAPMPGWVHAPGYRWMKSKQKFSSSPALHSFQTEG